MSKKKTLGEAIFVDIESNEYLNELHETILYNYALRLFQLENKKQPPGAPAAVLQRAIKGNSICQRSHPKKCCQSTG